MKNPKHIDNFKSVKDTRFSISEMSSNGDYHEYASGKTIEEVTERFYRRFMIRIVDQEMMIQSQRRNGFIMHHIKNGQRHLIENNILLLV